MVDGGSAGPDGRWPYAIDATRRDGTRAWGRSWTRSGHAQQYPVVRNMTDIFGHHGETRQPPGTW